MSIQGFEARTPQSESTIRSYYIANYKKKVFLTQSEPVWPQAAQVGIHLFCFYNTQLEKRLLMNQIKDTPLVKESKETW